MKHPMLVLSALVLLPGCGKTGTPERVEKAPSAAESVQERFSERAGPGLAVEGFDPSGSIQLSGKATSRLGITTEKMSAGEGIRQVPVESIVEVIVKGVGVPFVYLRRPDGWLERHPVKTGDRHGRRVDVLSGLTPGMEYVAQGAALVRLAELDLVSDEESE